MIDRITGTKACVNKKVVTAYRMSSGYIGIANLHIPYRTRQLAEDVAELYVVSSVSDHPQYGPTHSQQLHPIVAGRLLDKWLPALLHSD